MASETIKGNCECCDSEDVTLTTRHGMAMCQSCVSREDSIPVIPVTVSVANNLLEQSRAIDASIQIKTDIFKAATVAAQTLKLAIDADDTIPGDQKDYVMARESLARFQHLQKVIFEERQALLVKENELRMWQTQVQQFAGNLRAELKKQFQSFDVSYQPATPEKVKSPSQGGKKKSFKREELNAAASKYGVPAQAIQFLIVQKNMSAEDAAKHLATTMGLIKQ